MKIDTGWFMELILSKYGSQRQFAKVFKMEQSQLSRMINGDRKMNLDEAEDLAALLEVPVCAILSHAGVDMSDVDALLNALNYYSKGSDAKRATAALKKWRQPL